MTKQTFRDLWLGSNQQVLMRIQGHRVKLSNYVLKGLGFMFGIRNVQDAEYTGLFYMQQVVKYLWTKQFVWIKQNFGIYKIQNRQITLYLTIKILNLTAFFILHIFLIFNQFCLWCPIGSLVYFSPRSGLMNYDMQKLLVLVHLGVIYGFVKPLPAIKVYLLKGKYSWWF